MLQRSLGLLKPSGIRGRHSTKAAEKLPTTRTEAEQRDKGDPIAGFRERFLLPKNLIYLAGNSLGPPTREAADQFAGVVREQWGSELAGA